MKSWTRVWTSILVTILSFSWGTQPAKAAPFDRQFTFSLPNGQALTLHGWGDDFSAIFETLDGYTVVFDSASGYYHYAVQGADGRLASSWLVVTVDDPATAGILPGVRPDPEVAKADRRMRVKQWEEDTGVRERWAELKAQHHAVEAGLRAPPSTTTLGSKLGLTLLVDFSDQVGTFAPTEVNNFFNGSNYTGYGNNGSVKAYFYDNSAGLLTYTNVVVGYIHVPKPKTYYDNPSNNCGTMGRELLQDAITVMKSWPNYDSEIRPLLEALTVDGSNNAVACNVYYAGTCNSGWTYGLWPHSWVLASPVELWSGGKKVWRYQVTNMGANLELGTICHENGHMLCGFPDIYDYDYDSRGGAGKFCLMNSGGHGTNPTQICAYLKLAAGWATSVTGFTTSTQTFTLSAANGVNGNHFLRLVNPSASTEYFLIENRQQAGRDAALPAAGIAVWHIDELGDHNNQSLTWNTSHQNYECSLEQADGLWHFQANANYGDSRDLHYQGNLATGYTNTFNDSTTVSARWWSGAESRLRLDNFSVSGTSMTLNGYLGDLSDSTPPLIPGDCNCDGQVTIDDIQPFILVMFNPAQYVAQFPQCNPLSADCNQDGRIDGADIQSFVICSSPLAPSYCMAARDDTTLPLDVIVTWQDNSDDETVYRIARSTDRINWTHVGEVPANSTKFIDSAASLQNGVTYWYKVRAERDGLLAPPCYSGYSNEESAIPLCPVLSPPGLMEAARDDSTVALDVILTWSDTSTFESRFQIARSREGGDFINIADVPAGTGTGLLTYRDTHNLEDGVRYTYRLRAVYDNSQCGSSSPWSATKDALPRYPSIQAPSACVATRDDYGCVGIVWQDNSGNETGFNIARSLDQVNWTQVGAVGVNQTSFLDCQGLQMGRRYYYQIRACLVVDSTVTLYSSYSNIDDAIPRPPTMAAPTRCNAARDGSTPELDVVITWQDNSGNETGFNISRSRDQANWTQVGSVGSNQTSFRDSANLQTGVTYYYRVRAVLVGSDETFYSDYSNIDDAIPR